MKVASALQNQCPAPKGCLLRDVPFLYGHEEDKLALEDVVGLGR